MKKMKSDCIDHSRKGCRDGYWKTSKVIDGVKHYVMKHRLVYCEANNKQLHEISGLEVRHTCDNSRCINPEHLTLGTHADNMNDMKVRKRAASGERSGVSKLTWEGVREIRGMASCGYSHTFIAAHVGINHRTVGQVVRRETWKE